MATEGVDQGKRRFLTNATVVVGAVGAGFVAVPFIASWSPSERAKTAGAPIEADISKLDEGRMMTVEWRGKPVWIVKRTPKNLEDLPSLDDTLRDPASENAQQPAYAQNANRSIKPGSTSVFSAPSTIHRPTIGASSASSRRAWYSLSVPENAINRRPACLK